MNVHPIDDQESLRRLEDICRKQGLPLTVQRRVVLETVLGREDHPTTDQVYEDVRGRIPGISRTTVYRVLDMLVRVGVISKACHPGAAARFDRNTRQHHHLVCLHCDRVIDVEDERLNALKLPSVSRFDFEIIEFRVQLRGICANCRKTQSTSKKKSTATTSKPTRKQLKPIAGKRRSHTRTPKQISKPRRTKP